MIAIVIIVEVILAASIVVLDNNYDKHSSHDASVLARVNTDGSGIYISVDYPVSDFITIDEKGDVTFHKEGWGGKVFGTPGSSTIQHIQLMDIVTNKLGMKFVNYDGVSEKRSDTVYFSDKITNYDQAVSTDFLDGGIIWEPQYHRIVDDSGIFKEMTTTNVLFPGHTCCLVIGNQNFLNNNPMAASKFLAAYMEAVDFINDAKAGDVEKYATIIKICKDNIKGVTEEVITDALNTVIYKYSDKEGTADLDDLKVDISKLAKNLTELGSIKVKMSELGLASYDQFAEIFVDSSYLKKAFEVNEDRSTNVKIVVSAIEGDIHQIALQIANDLGFFEKYGIEVEIKKLANGGMVSLDLLSGQSDIGFAGAPPITSNTINGKHIVVA